MHSRSSLHSGLYGTGQHGNRLPQWNLRLLNTPEQPAFWDYSIALYAQEGVAPACIILQDRYGFDVNLVLFCLWYGEQAGKMTAETLTEALQLSRLWSELAVIPLRNVRTRIKGDLALQALPEAEEIAAFREQVKRLELGAEKIQQQMLERLAESRPGSRDDSEAESGDWGETNLAMLASTMGLELNCKTQPQLQIILAAREKSGAWRSEVS